jgi:uncharacterized Zn finger protein
MYYGWKPYVPASARREKAAKKAAKLAKKGHTLSPVTASRGAIAKSFWGKSWCENLERYSDFSNRLPRGRTYLRNGSVIDLKIAAGEATAQVMGSSLYRVKVQISAVADTHWQSIARDCARSIDTLVELLQGQLSASVMERITRPGTGLFPSPKEIKFSCSCPDSAAMCKHIAATLYGIGARLDAEPHLLFGLRRVDAKELIARAGESDALPQKTPRPGRILDSSKLADVFGLDLPPVGPQSGESQSGESQSGESQSVRKPPAKTAVNRKGLSAPRKGKAVAGVGAGPRRKPARG